MGSGQIQHVFVLMLENRSFDHMLGFSGLTVTDASTGASTKINGLSGTESNCYSPTQLPVLHARFVPSPCLELHLCSESENDRALRTSSHVRVVLDYRL